MGTPDHLLGIEIDDSTHRPEEQLAARGGERRGGLGEVDASADVVAAVDSQGVGDGGIDEDACLAHYIYIPAGVLDHREDVTPDGRVL